MLLIYTELNQDKFWLYRGEEKQTRLDLEQDNCGWSVDWLGLNMKAKVLISTNHLKIENLR